MTAVPIALRQGGNISPVENVTHVELVYEGDQLVVHPPNPVLLKTKKSYQQLASSILVLYEIANREEEEGRKRQVFAELLLSLLKEW